MDAAGNEVPFGLSREAALVLAALSGKSELEVGKYLLVNASEPVLKELRQCGAIELSSSSIDIGGHCLPVHRLTESAQERGMLLKCQLWQVVDDFQSTTDRHRR